MFNRWKNELVSWQSAIWCFFFLQQMKLVNAVSKWVLINLISARWRECAKLRENGAMGFTVSRQARPVASRRCPVAVQRIVARSNASQTRPRRIRFGSQVIFFIHSFIHSRKKVSKKKSIESDERLSRSCLNDVKHFVIYFEGTKLLRVRRQRLRP